MSSSSNEDSPKLLQRRKNQFDRAKVGSKDLYIQTYKKFMDWKMYNHEENLDENVLLKYFKELSEQLQAHRKSSSYLLTLYWQLRAVIAKEHDILIESYTQLIAFLNELKNDPQIIWIPKKPIQTFTSENIERFLKSAPDDHYLVIKVALIFGVSGACKSRELSAITVDDIQHVSDELMMVNVRGTDSDAGRSFIVCGDHLHFVNKYLTMRRTLDIPTNKFFILYRKGKFVKCAMHKCNFNKMAKKIASFMNLANPELYTENCFRKTSDKLVSVVGEGFAYETEKERFASKRKTKRPEQQSFKNEKKIKRKSRHTKASKSKTSSVTEDPEPNICINIGDKSIKVQSSSNLNLVADDSNGQCFTWDESKDPLAANDSLVNDSDISDSDENSSDDESAINKKNKEATVKHVFKDCENVSNLFISL